MRRSQHEHNVHSRNAHRQTDDMSKRPTPAVSSCTESKCTRTTQTTTRRKLNPNLGQDGTPNLSSSGTGLELAADVRPIAALQAQYLLAGCNVTGSSAINWGRLGLEKHSDGTFRPGSSVVEICATPKDAIGIVSLQLIASHTALFSVGSTGSRTTCTGKQIARVGGRSQLSRRSATL